MLNNEVVHDILRGIWQQASDRNGWFVGDYLMMSDHVHFFARASRDALPMKKWIQMWKSVSAREWSKRTGRRGSLWQKDYFDRYLRNADNYSEKWSYVEANPVRAGLVAFPEDWLYRGRIHELRF